MKSLIGLFILLNTINLGFLAAQKPTAQAVELGKVTWMRSYDAALNESLKQDKPILILFQEVPGCATCRNYGEQVLSHPLLVDAIEHEFVPLVIYNNKGGEDRKILEKYKEPSWNNPVVRITDSQGKDLIERLSGNYSIDALILQMSLALRIAGKGEPEYLRLLKEEMTPGKLETAYYKMYCFWSGEAHLGAKEGVVATEPGWMGGAEVVKVTYASDKIKRKNLDRYAQQKNCKAVQLQKGYRIDKDPQYYLKKSPYRFLPLSAMQKTKINAALANKENANKYLSPTQLKWLEEKRSNKLLYDKELILAWNSMSYDLK